jgi:ligand-binding sensor domain-containing protein
MSSARLIFFGALAFLMSACSDQKTSDDSTAKQPDVAAIESAVENPHSAATPAPVEVLDVFNVGQNVYVRSLAVEDSNDTLWVGTSLGVLEIDLKSHDLRNTFTRDHGLANEYVFGIGIDSDGFKWFGTNAGGVSRYRDGEWKTFFPMHGLADYWIYSFANDPDGGLWIGTWAGANYLDRKSEKFTTYVKELINEWVYGITVDSQGRIWFGTEGGVSRYDGKEWVSWTHEDGLGGANPEALPFSRNTGLGTRSRHDLGIMASGQPTYNPNYVFSVLADKEDTIWAGTWGGGVAYFKDGKWSNLMMDDGLSGNIVYSLAQDDQGVYWFGTNRGLTRYDGQRWDRWNVHNGLPSNDVYAIQVHGQDVWVGTRGGVIRIGKKNAATN